jgi:hypothetical protein
MRMVLIKPKYVELSSLVNLLSIERENLKMNYKLGQKLQRVMNLVSLKKENSIRSYINRSAKKDLELIANSILDYVEQVKILDYILKLDKFRLQKKYENRNYRTENVDAFAVTTLYWPVNKEFWWDELPNYRVLISDKCRNSSNE